MTTTTKSDLEVQVKDLTQQLQEEREKTKKFTQVLGQMRWRVFEVLELEPQIRTQIVNEIDTVLDRVL